MDGRGRPRLTFTSALIESARNSDEIALIVAHEAAHHIAGYLGRLNAKVTETTAQRNASLGAIGATHAQQLRGGNWSEVQARQRGFELAADKLGRKL